MAHGSAGGAGYSARLDHHRLLPRGWRPSGHTLRPVARFPAPTLRFGSREKSRPVGSGLRWISSPGALRPPSSTVAPLVPLGGH